MSAFAIPGLERCGMHDFPCVQALDSAGNIATGEACCYNEHMRRNDGWLHAVQRCSQRR